MTYMARADSNKLSFCTTAYKALLGCLINDSSNQDISRENKPLVIGVAPSGESRCWISAGTNESHPHAYHGRQSCNRYMRCDPFAPAHSQMPLAMYEMPAPFVGRLSLVKSS